MPTPEKLQEMIELSTLAQEHMKAYKLALANFTKSASELNYMMLEELDYYAAIRDRSPYPEWVRQLPSKQWMFDHPRKAVKPTQKTKKKQIANQMFNTLMKGYK